jgi:hypothetical protein
MREPFIVLLPWFVPKVLGKLYALSLISFGIFLNKVGLHAPVYFDWAYGANAAHASTAIVSDDYYMVVEARACWTTAGSDGSAVTLTIEKLTGTQAPGGGANMFKTSTINLKGTANTSTRLASSSLSGLTAAQAAAQLLAPGDRISATLGGVLTALAGLSVVVICKRTRPQQGSAR